MKGHLVHLFEYTRWAHALVAQSVAAHAPLDPRCESLYAHIVAAEQVWLARMRGQTPNLPVWPEHRIVDSARAAQQSAAAWIAFIDEASESDLKAPRAYTNTKGDAFENSVKEIATQVVNHGIHHRAQISARLRELGGTPPPTDYLFYLREHPKPAPRASVNSNA